MDEVHLTALDLSCWDRNKRTSVIWLLLLFQEDLMCNNFSMVVRCVLIFSQGRAGRGKVVVNAFVCPTATQYSSLIWLWHVWIVSWSSVRGFQLPAWSVVSQGRYMGLVVFLVVFFVMTTTHSFLR